jgi:hypothetical protein
MDTDTAVTPAHITAFDDERTVAMDTEMAAQGVAPLEHVPTDYFAFDEDFVIDLPDGVSKIFHKVLNEGKRTKYLSKVNRDVKFQKSTGDAIMRVGGGTEKAALLGVAITGWQLTSGGQAVPFSPQNLTRFLESANPKIVDLIEREVKKKNPWLLQDMTVEDIDAEIESLQEIRATVLAETEGKAASNV